MGTWWFENSRYSVINHLVANVTRLFWQIVAVPAAILAPLFGIDLETHPDLAGLGDIGFMIVADGVAFGIVGAFVGWRVAEARFGAEFPQPPESEKMLSRGIPAKTIYWKTIFRRGAWGGLLGFSFNLIVLGLAVATSGGHSPAGLIAGWLSLPTYTFGNALLGWPKSDTSFTIAVILTVCLLNAVLIALLSMFITAVTEIWLFFRKR